MRDFEASPIVQEPSGGLGFRVWGVSAASAFGSSNVIRKVKGFGVLGLKHSKLRGLRFRSLLFCLGLSDLKLYWFEVLGLKWWGLPYGESSNEVVLHHGHGCMCWHIALGFQLQPERPDPKP